ncbi:MAG: hypothetical protein G01um1014107_337 [Parcubacteria group bacterium Gr01-1014_107]|nr:MAG: hypothetical protein G01um1014107_337 [Parcubacteria group bacterium Gr01-1014_107]
MNDYIFLNPRTNFAFTQLSEARVADSHTLDTGAALRPTKVDLFGHALRKIILWAKLVRGDAFYSHFTP